MQNVTNAVVYILSCIVTRDELTLAISMKSTLLLKNAFHES